jgi:Domain of unknown function (DUF4276)
VRVTIIWRERSSDARCIHCRWNDRKEDIGVAVPGPTDPSDKYERTKCIYPCNCESSIICYVDRETREPSSEALELELRHCLRENGANVENVIIAFPDRMIENWMLADHHCFKYEYGIEIVSICEGKHGKNELSSVLRAKGITYHEITVGVDIFKRLSPAAIARHSMSFDRFRKNGNPFCQWLRKTL